MIFETPNVSREQATIWIREKRGAFERILMAHGDGAHMFVPSDVVLRCLLDGVIGLSDTQRSVVEMIRDGRSELRGHALIASFTVLTAPTADAHYAWRSNQKVVTALDRFSDAERTLPTKLLVEDRLDAELLLLYCDALRTYLGYGFAHRMEPVHGGGTRIAREYAKHACDLVSPIVCVADSDQLFPGGARGDTAVTLCDTDATNDLASVVILPYREVENTIPIPLVDGIYGGDSDVRHRLEPIQRLWRHAPGATTAVDGLRFIDLKHGFTPSDLEAMPPEGQAFWEGVAGIMFPAARGTRAWEGVSANLLRTAVHHIARLSVSEVRQHLTASPFFGEIAELVHQLSSAGSAPHRSRAR